MLHRIKSIRTEGVMVAAQFQSHVLHRMKSIRTEGVMVAAQSRRERRKGIIKEAKCMGGFILYRPLLLYI